MTNSGKLLITREHDAVPPSVAADRAIRAVTEGLASSIAGVDIIVRAETICVHSDTPNAVAIVRAVREALSPYISTHSSPRMRMSLMQIPKKLYALVGIGK